jgi:hypothetical protein
MANNQLTEYIVSRRQQGADDEQIVQELTANRWNEQIVRAAMGQHVDFTPHRPDLVPPPNMAAPAPSLPNNISKIPKRRSGLPKFVIVFLLLIILGLGIWVYLLLVNPPQPRTAQEENSVSHGEVILEPFVDTNFEMQIAQGWQGDAAYKPGGNLIQFYSPEDANDANRPKAAYMEIYVIKKSPTDTIDSRINSQINSLTETESNFQKLSDEQRTLGEATARTVELVIATKERPETKIHLLSTTVIRGDVSYHIEVSSLEEYWHLHNEAAKAMTDSFRPKAAHLTEN